jgi:Transposase zinc-ribbon domain
LGSLGQPFAEFREAFPDEESCARYLAERRWPKGFSCACGSVRHWPLKGRAHTFEGVVCRHHTSITSGTAMHGSHLLLRKWFYAAHLIATHSGSISARQLQTRLRVAYQTASELKRKLQITEMPADTKALKGCVEVAQKELKFKVYDRYLDRVMCSKRFVVITV